MITITWTNIGGVLDSVTTDNEDTAYKALATMVGTTPLHAGDTFTVSDSEDD